MRRPAKKLERPGMSLEKINIDVKHLEPPVDCKTCKHHVAWMYGLIDCKYRICPQPNCKDNNIKCVNFKKIES